MDDAEIVSLMRDGMDYAKYIDITPLLAEGYAKITLVDIRYISPSVLGQFLTFAQQDVLFLYSTSVLNNSITIK